MNTKERAALVNMRISSMNSVDGRARSDKEVTNSAKTQGNTIKHSRPPMAELSLQQQSRSFSGYMRQLIAHLRRMLRTAQAKGYSQDQLRGLVEFGPRHCERGLMRLNAWPE